MIPQTAMDLEGAAGFRRTKDEHSKEPALVVQRNTCCKYLSCIFLVLLAAGLFVWQSDAALRRIAPMLAAKRARARAAQHTAHSRFTSIGQELEQHLEQEMKETEIALRLRSRLRELEKLHRKNVTRALDAAAIGDAAVTFQARDAVKPYLEDAVDALFEELRSVIDARILQPMMSSGAQAKQRHDALHQEVLEELRKDKVERDAFLKAKHAQPGDIDGDGFQEHTDDYTPNWTDDHYDEEAARKRDEQWRNEVVEHFAESFAHHFNDTAAKEDGLQPRATLTEADPLFEELTKLGDALGYPGAWDAVSSNETAPRLSWREAEKKLKSLEPQLKKHRCHQFEPSEEPEDDEYDYMQIHNVEHYISEMKWHAKLNSHRDEIVGKLAEHASSKISTMELVEHLETLEGERVFPSFWLFHAPGSYDDYRYGDW